MIGKLPLILIATDDRYELLARQFMEETSVSHPFRFVSSGQSVIDYLVCRDLTRDDNAYPLPGLIFLNLAVLGAQWREVLQFIRTHPACKTVPVLIVAPGPVAEDIVETCYACGCNGFFTRPASVPGYFSLLRIVLNYWLHTVTLPPRSRSEYSLLHQNG